MSLWKGTKKVKSKKQKAKNSPWIKKTFIYIKICSGHVYGYTSALFFGKKTKKKYITHNI